jgi:Tol biopolymer transport system component
VILYEMVSGRMPFLGDYEQATIYGILNAEPEPLTAVRTGVPMEIERIVRKCMTKDAARRYQSSTDLIVDLESLDLLPVTTSYSGAQISGAASGHFPVSGETSVPSLEGSSGVRRWLRVGPPAAVTALILGTALGYALRSPAESEPAPVRRFELIFPQFSDLMNPVVSPDGTFMLFVAQDSSRRSVYRYELATRELKLLLPISASHLRIDPEGTRVLYRDPTHIYVAPADGGTPTPVNEYGSGYPNFLPDGSIIFDLNESLWIASADGAEIRSVSRVDSANGEAGHYNPWPIPGGRYVLFHATRVTGEGRQLGVFDLDSGKHRLIGPGASPTYVPSGHVIYVDGEMSAQGRILIRPMNPESAEWLGPAVTLSPAAHIKDYTVDALGTMYWTRRSSGSSVIEREWVIMLNMKSRDEQPVKLVRRTSNLRVSPFDSLLAYSYETGQEGSSQLAILDVAAGVEQRIAPGVDIRHSAWASDGRHLYVARTGRAIQKWSIETLQPVETIETGSAVGSFDVSPDGRLVAYVVDAGTEAGPLRLLDRETGRETQVSAEPTVQPRISPDGRHIAYTAAPAGSPPAVMVYSVEQDRTTLVSGEFESATSGDWWEAEYLYMTVDDTDIARLPVTTDPVFRPAGRAELLMSMAQPAALDIGGDFAVMYFDAATAGDQSDVNPAGVTLDVTVNWSTEARRVAPVTK